MGRMFLERCVLRLVWWLFGDRFLVFLVEGLVRVGLVVLGVDGGEMPSAVGVPISFEEGLVEGLGDVGLLLGFLSVVEGVIVGFGLIVGVHGLVMILSILCSRTGKDNHVSASRTNLIRSSCTHLALLRLNLLVHASLLPS